MAITHTDKRTGERTVSFEGRVLSGAQASGRFLMSDYGIGYYATVWNGTERQQVCVGVGDVGDDYMDEVIVDASDALLAEIARIDADNRERRRLEAEAEALLREWTVVRKGDAVVVFKGRKVAKGTKGVVAWLGSNAFGTSVGLRVEGSEGLVFTNIANVKRDHSEAAKASEIEAAHESAIWYEANVIAPKRSIATLKLAKGSRVTPKVGAYAGKACRVIWAGVRDGAARVGVVPATKGRFNADWLDIAQVILA